MKNKYIKTISIIIILFLTIFCLNRIVNVKADSGWDTDYDSGLSWDSGSSWDSSSSSSSGDGYGFNFTDSEVFLILGLALSPFIILLIYINIKTKIEIKKIDYITKHPKRSRLTQEQVNKVIPDFDIYGFIDKSYEMFYDIQIAWMNFDYNKLKDLLTDELYNTYVMDLEALKIKNQKNIMTNFKLVSAELVGLKKENGVYIAKVIIEVGFIDYVEDTITHEVLRGNSYFKIINKYMLTFERTKDIIKENTCPNCGSKVEGNVSGVCEYCNSKLINETYDWVMSKKEKISQR